MKLEKQLTNGRPSNGSEPRYTFEEVKEMIEKLLSQQGRSCASATAQLRRVEFEDLVPPGHTVESCKDLLEQLVQNTRRVRTLREVLADIKDNLKKNRYTEIIARNSIRDQLPKRPTSAYLLYHADRYNELRNENNLACEISKIVAEEWKKISDKKRRHYQRKHEEALANYENEMRRLGLVDDAAPKRPKSAKTLYVDQCMSQLNLENWTKEDISSKRDKLAIAYEQLSNEDKQYWLERQKENQEKYLAERAAFVEAHPHLSHQGTQKKQKTSHKITPPEPPKTAMKFYIARKMPEDIKPDQAEQLIKTLKEQFNNLREKKLLKYIKKAVQDKERYDKEVEQFNKQHPEKAISIPKGRTNLTKEQMKIYTRVVENRPEMPAPTAYLHYCGKMLTELNLNDDEHAPTLRMKHASESWRNANPKEKKQAIKMHTEEMERYVYEMERWLATQPEERRLQLLSEEPKANPDLWKKKLNRMRKRDKKQEKTPVATRSPVKNK